MCSGQSRASPAQNPGMSVIRKAAAFRTNRVAGCCNTWLGIYHSVYFGIHRLDSLTHLYGPHWIGLGYTDSPTSPPNLMFLYLKAQNTIALGCGLGCPCVSELRPELLSPQPDTGSGCPGKTHVSLPRPGPSSAPSSESHDFANPPHLIRPSLQVLT